MSGQDSRGGRRRLSSGHGAGRTNRGCSVDTFDNSKTLPVVQQHQQQGGRGQAQAQRRSGLNRPVQQQPQQDQFVPSFPTYHHQALHGHSISNFRTRRPNQYCQERTKIIHKMETIHHPHGGITQRIIVEKCIDRQHRVLSEVSQPTVNRY
jgi:hypothetical protein